jgi:hypothetical protein
MEAVAGVVCYPLSHVGLQGSGSAGVSQSSCVGPGGLYGVLLVLADWDWAWAGRPLIELACTTARNCGEVWGS